jgi:hypothetical protein
LSLARHQFTVTDQSGNIVPGAHVEVRSEIPGQPLVALYSDRAGTVALGNPIDADSNGYVYFHVVGGAYQIRVYTGTSAAPTTEHFDRYVPIGLNSESDSIASRTQRPVTAAGAVTIDAADADIVIVKKTVGAATTVNLPLSASRTVPIMIVDGKGDANTNNITIVPQTGESIYAVVNQTAIIDGNGGSVILTPKGDGTGWF